MRYTLSLLLMVFGLISFAQVDSTATGKPLIGGQTDLLPKKDKEGLIIGKQKGHVRYIQDERITILDEYLAVHPKKHEGYRIQLIFGSRQAVAAARSRFLAEYDFSAYEDYLPPNFRLRVGDFMDRYQAEKALRELKEDFPGAYLVKDKIEVPKQFR